MRLQDLVAELGVADALAVQARADRLLGEHAVTLKCLPMSRRKSSAGIGPVHSRLFTMRAGLSPSKSQQAARPGRGCARPRPRRPRARSAPARPTCRWGRRSARWPRRPAAIGRCPASWSRRMRDELDEVAEVEATARSGRSRSRRSPAPPRAAAAARRCVGGMAPAGPASAGRRAGSGSAMGRPEYSGRHVPCYRPATDVLGHPATPAPWRRPPAPAPTACRGPSAAAVRPHGARRGGIAGLPAVIMGVFALAGGGAVRRRHGGLRLVHRGLPDVEQLENFSSTRGRGSSPPTASSSPRSRSSTRR